MPNIPLKINLGRYFDGDGENRLLSTNMYPSFNQTDGTLSPTKARRTCGLAAFTTTVTGAYAGYATLNSDTTVLYMNVGLRLFRVPSAGGAPVDEGGAVNIIGSGWASMAYNPQEIMAVVKGGNGYFFDRSTTTTTAIADATYLAILGGGPCVAVVYIGGYFVFASETEVFSASLYTVNKGRNFSVNDTLLPEYKQDQIRDLLVVDDLLWVIKQTTIEVYQNTGEAGFPFNFVYAIELGGCVHGRAIAQGSSVYLIGRQNDTPYGIYRITGRSITKISNDYIDMLLTFNSLDIDPFTQNQNQKILFMEHDGHKFIGVYLSAQDRTFVYDETESSRVGTPVWHQRISPNSNLGYFTKDTINAYNKNLALGSITGFAGVAEIQESTVTEFTLDVLRYFSTQYLENGIDKVSVKQLQIKAHSDSGNVYLGFTVDRGLTYSILNSVTLDSPIIKWARLGTHDIVGFIISNSPDLATPDANSSDLTVYGAWATVE